MRRVTILVVIGLLFGLAQTAIPADDDAEQGVQKVSKRSTRLYIRSTPSGARIKLDGQPRGTSDLLITLPAGTKRVTLEVELDGYLPHQQKDIEIRGGWIRRIEVELEKAPATDAATPESEQEKPQPAEIPATPVVPPQPAAQVAAVWTCPMHPQIKLPKPGKCPACAMDLVRTQPSAPRRVVKVTPVPLGPVEKALLQKTTLEFVEVPLQDVAQLIDEKMSGVNVLLDHKALDELGLDGTSPLSVSVKDVSMRSALNITLRPLDLAWTIRHGVLVITTREEAENQLKTKIYPAGDLTDDHDTLIEIITGIVQPVSWDDVGGPGSICADSTNAGTALVVSQTDAIHFEVADLLAELRRIVAKDPNMNRGGQTISVEEAIEKAMDKRVSIEFQEQPLDALVEYLRSTLTRLREEQAAAETEPIRGILVGLGDGQPLHLGQGQQAMGTQQEQPTINVLIDRRALEDVGIDGAVPITINLSEVYLRTVLDLALEQIGLTWMIRDEALWITTPEEAGMRLDARIYDVDDLECEMPDLPEVITGLVWPETWDDAGGPGSIGPATIGGVKVLIVSQERQVHYGIARLLRNLRNASSRHAITIVDDFRYGSPGFAPRGRVDEAIDRVISVDYRNVPLRDVVSHVGETTRINVMVDRRALEDIGLDEDVTITRGMDAKLSTILDTILRELDLAWTVRNDVLLITTQEKLSGKLTTGIYDVTNLVRRLNSKREPVPDSSFLIDIITSSLQPTSWDSVGGPGSIGRLDFARANNHSRRNTLVISQTRDGHAEIAGLLTALRHLSAQTGSGELPKPLMLDLTESKEAEKIQKIMSRKVDVEFEKLPLRDLTAWLKGKYGLEAQLDYRALEDAGLAADTNVSIGLKDVELGSALELMFEPIDLAYMVWDGVLLITTSEEADSHLITGFYPVEDLIAHRDYYSLMEMITSTVAPDTWEDIGGAGSVAAASSDYLEVLVVSQTADVHRKVAALLADLRAQQPDLPAPKLGPRDHPNADGTIESEVLKEATIQLLAQFFPDKMKMHPMEPRYKAAWEAWSSEVFPRVLRARLFSAPPDLARRYADGKFDEAYAKKRIQQQIERSEKSKREPSEFANYLIMQVLTNKLSGAQLEAAARLLHRSISTPSVGVGMGGLGNPPNGMSGGRGMGQGMF